MTDKPRVSVIITSYNYEKYIEQTVKSALQQSYSNLEVIVVDDGSSDRSLEILNRLAVQDPRIQVVTHKDNKNLGLAASLCLALSKARGDLVAFLESDDYWSTTSLSDRIHVLTATKAEIIVGGIELIKENDADVSWYLSYLKRIYSSFKQFSSDGQASFSLEDDFLYENQIPTFSCVLAKRELFKNVNFDSPVQKWLDWWIWSQLSMNCRFGYCDSICTFWRIHKGSYNSKVKIISYLNDGGKIWKGFRQQFSLMYRDRGKYRQYLFLQTPFFLRLFIRLCMIIKYEGFKSGAFRIKTRVFGK